MPKSLFSLFGIEKGYETALVKTFIADTESEHVLVLCTGA